MLGLPVVEKAAKAVEGKSIASRYEAYVRSGVRCKGRGGWGLVLAADAAHGARGRAVLDLVLLQLLLLMLTEELSENRGVNVLGLNRSVKRG